MQLPNSALVVFDAIKATLTDFVSLLHASCRLFPREVGQNFRHILRQISQYLVGDRHLGYTGYVFCHDLRGFKGGIARTLAHVGCEGLRSKKWV